MWSGYLKPWLSPSCIFSLLRFLVFSFFLQRLWCAGKPHFSISFELFERNDLNSIEQLNLFHDLLMSWFFSLLKYLRFFFLFRRIFFPNCLIAIENKLRLWTCMHCIRAARMSSKHRVSIDMYFIRERFADYVRHVWYAMPFYHTGKYPYGRTPFTVWYSHRMIFDAKKELRFNLPTLFR